MVFSPPLATLQILWCTCSWDVPRRRCIGLIGAQRASANWMIESWPRDILDSRTGDGCARPSDDLYTFCICHREFKLKLRAWTWATAYIFMDIHIVFNWHQEERLTCLETYICRYVDIYTHTYIYFDSCVIFLCARKCRKRILPSILFIFVRFSAYGTGQCAVVFWWWCWLPDIN